MKKIPFTFDAWLKDKSQKVVHANGSKVIGFVSLPIEWVAEEMQANELFLIPAEPELTEFEKALERMLNKDIDEQLQYSTEVVKAFSAELLAIARKELLKDFDKTLNDAIQEGYIKGKADTLEDIPRWKKSPMTYTGWALFGNDTLYHNGFILNISDLEKLPHDE